jgi:DNA-binding NarL/FixJ family response regulator
MDSMRLLLVDDHVLFRESLGRLLASEPDFEVAGQCGSCAEALAFLARDHADMVLLDLDLPDGRGVGFIPSARDAGYRGKVLLVTGAVDAETSSEALQKGVCGIVLKHNPVGSLLRAIRTTAAGDLWLDPKVVEYLAMRAPRSVARPWMEALTERESAVLQLLLEGLTNRSIAERLSLTEGSVKSTLQALFEKSQVRTRSQLVRMSIEGPGEKGS